MYIYRNNHASAHVLHWSKMIVVIIIADPQTTLPCARVEPWNRPYLFYNLGWSVYHKNDYALYGHQYFWYTFLKAGGSQTTEQLN